MLTSPMHTPVMAPAVIRMLRPRAGGTYVDATVGYGGHAAKILEASQPDGRLFGIDRDRHALAGARKILSSFRKRCVLVNACFDEAARVVREHGVDRVDGVLADLGVSSAQLDVAGRGFSFAREGPLDMRMDATCGKSAADIVAAADERELADIIYRYGEERRSRRIARLIVEARGRAPIETTATLAGIVARAYPPGRRRIHPATRTFQALRIAVNDELGMLERFLERIPALLASGGRVVIISYHSLEDRMIKRTFRSWDRQAGTVLTKKVMKPDDEEVQRNPRARSAKLRAFERA